MPTSMQSFDQSALGAFVESPLGARNGVGSHVVVFLGFDSVLSLTGYQPGTERLAAYLEDLAVVDAFLGELPPQILSLTIGIVQVPHLVSGSLGSWSWSFVSLIPLSESGFPPFVRYFRVPAALPPPDPQGGFTPFVPSIRNEYLALTNGVEGNITKVAIYMGVYLSAAANDLAIFLRPEVDVLLPFTLGVGGRWLLLIPQLAKLAVGLPV